MISICHITRSKEETLNLGHKSRWSQHSGSCAHINHQFQFISIEMVSTKWIADMHIHSSWWIWFVCLFVRACDLDRMAYLCVCVRACVLLTKSHENAFHFCLMLNISTIQKNSFVIACIILNTLDWFFFGVPLSSLYPVFCLRNSSFCYVHILFLFTYRFDQTNQQVK